jgi:hypothetical protein
MSIPDEPYEVDNGKPHPARRYNYWLGGKDNFAADRVSGDAIANEYPQIIIDAAENRDWTHRVVRYLATEHGVRQFLDIGAGIPLTSGLHRIAQEADPAARIVYVDNDRLVMVHARALLTGTPQGRTAYALVDMRDPDALLKHPEVADTLDFDRPIAVLYAAVLHFVEDDAQAYKIVRQVIDELPPGSFLAVSNFTTDGLDDTVRDLIEQRIAAGRDGPFRPRSLAEFTRFFDGLTLIDPGICPVSEWRPGPAGVKAIAAVYGAVARKDG